MGLSFFVASSGKEGLEPVARAARGLGVQRETANT